MKEMHTAINKFFPPQYKKLMALKIEDRTKNIQEIHMFKDKALETLQMLMNKYELSDQLPEIEMAFYDYWRGYTFELSAINPKLEWEHIEAIVCDIVYGLILLPFLESVEKKDEIERLYNKISNPERERTEIVKLLSGYCKYWGEKTNDDEGL